MATINGTTGDDVLAGTSGDDTIHGLGGNDTIDGLGGTDQLFGDGGNDTFNMQANSGGYASIDGGAGLDTLTLNYFGFTSQITQVDSSTFAVNLFGAPIASVTNVEEIILGEYWTVKLPNWTGNLKIVSDSHISSSITTGPGNDTITGGPGNDSVSFNGGNDVIDLAGGSGQLSIETISGHADHVIASASPDPANLQTAFLAVLATALTAGAATIDLAAGTASIGATTFSLSGFHGVEIEGSAYISTVRGDDSPNYITYLSNNSTSGAFVFDGRGGNDTLIGGISNDQIDGGDGNDTVNANDGNDVVRGGSGNDSLAGGRGDNFLDGGVGDDYLNGGGYPLLPGGLHPTPVNSGSDTISGGDGSDHIWGSDQNSFAGSADGADSISGGDGNDYINGNAGADTIDGGAGNDRLRGGRDGDLIQGGDGNDTILGDAGADTIHGGAGFDYMTGGADADVFAFSAYGPLSLSEAPLHTAGPSDVVADYQDGVDKFSLGFAPAAVLAGSALTPAAAATVAQQLLDGHAGDHEVAAVQVGADTYLFFSATGGGGVDSEVQVVGAVSTSFDTSDFV